MDIILKKNEAEINEAVAKGLLVVFGIVLLISGFCWSGIFDISPDMTIILLIATEDYKKCFDKSKEETYGEWVDYIKNYYQ